MLAARTLLEEARCAYMRFLEWYELPGTSEQHLVEEAHSLLAQLAGVKEVIREPQSPRPFRTREPLQCLSSRPAAAGNADRAATGRIQDSSGGPAG